MNWRQITHDQITEGMTIQARRQFRDAEYTTGGTAHHRDDEGDWLTVMGNYLTAASYRHDETYYTPELNERTTP